MGELHSFEWHREKKDIEQHLDNPARQESYFGKIYRQIPALKPEDFMAKGYVGLEFNGDGSIVSIKKKSPAEKTFADIIAIGHDHDFQLEPPLTPHPEYYVFVQSIQEENQGFTDAKSSEEPSWQRLKRAA